MKKKKYKIKELDIISINNESLVKGIVGYAKSGPTNICKRMNPKKIMEILEMKENS